MPAPKPTRDELARMIDHAVLKPQATPSDLEAACELVRSRRVGCLCVRPCDVAEAAERLRGGDTLVGTVISFPHGVSSTAAKAAESRQAVADGAAELDMVLNIGRLIAGDLDYVRDDIRTVVDASEGRTVKVIFECCYLSPERIRAACRASLEARAGFVKTSTGFGEYGARVEDVRLMRECVGPNVGVKASGGIRTLDDVLAMIEAGADRLGTSSTAALLDALPE